MDTLSLNTPSLTEFIKDTPMAVEQRKELLEDLPYMNREQRIELCKTLFAIQELEHEKQQAIKFVRKQREEKTE
ncbi:MAG: hypothetical protein AAB567_02825 [Patescibacteria group bacterium]